MKRFLSCLLIISITLSCFPKVANAAQATDERTNTVVLPIAQSNEEGYELQGTASTFALTPNSAEYSYAYIGAEEIRIGRDTVIYQPGTTTPSTTEPVANGILQMINGAGEVVAASAAVDSYGHSSGENYEDSSDDYYYVSYVELLSTETILAGTYGLQLAAGNQAYPCSGGVIVVGTDSMLITEASVSDLYAGVDTFEVWLRIYGFQTEDDLGKLSFQLLGDNSAVIAVSTGAYRDISTNYSGGGWYVYAQMRVEQDKTIEENAGYSLQISYSGAEELVDGVGTAQIAPHTPSLEIAGFEVTNAQTAEVAVTLENWDGAKNYRIVVADSYSDGTVYGEAAMTGVELTASAGVAFIPMTMSGVTIPMTGYGNQLYVRVYEGDSTYSRISKSVQNPYANADQGRAYFYPYYIKTTASGVPFSIDHHNDPNVIGEGDVLSMRDDAGNEVGACDNMTDVRDGSSGTLTGTLSVTKSLANDQYYLYLNDIQFDTVFVTDELSLTSSVPMTENDSFWSNLGVFPMSVDAINSSGTGSFVFKEGSNEVLSSGMLTGTPSKYYEHLLYQHTFTKQDFATLRGGFKYTLVFRDSTGAEKTLYGSQGLTYTEALQTVDFGNSEHANVRWWNAKGGDTTLVATVYLGRKNGPRNITQADLLAAVQGLSVSNGSDAIAVTNYQADSAAAISSSYDLLLTLASSLTQGDYTAYFNGTKIDTFTVSAAQQDTDTTPHISNADVMGGYIYGSNLPTDGTYTGKLYSGYTCLTATAFPLTLQGENNGDSQYLYFNRKVLTNLAVGDYELRAYLGSKVLGSVSMTIKATSQPIVDINDDDGDWNDGGDPVMHSSGAQINVSNGSAYGYIRWAETEAALASIHFQPHFSNGYYYHSFEGQDGPRTLYVELSKTGNAAGQDNIIYPFNLFLCTDGDYDVRVPQSIQGVQNVQGDTYTITATAELPATKLWVSFYDAQGNHASQQMRYTGVQAGRHQFELTFGVEEWDYFSDYSSYNGSFYYKDTTAISVFATDLSDKYHSDEAYRGKIMSVPVKRVLLFGDPTGVVMPQFTNGAALTNHTDFTLYGYAMPNSLVTVTENTVQLGTVTADEYGHFSIQLAGLAGGEHVLEAACGGILGSGTLTVDIATPTVSNVGFTFLAENSAVVHWSCADTDIDYYEVYKNGTRLGRAAADTSSYNVSASADDGNNFTIKAYDMAGNVGEKTVSTADQEPPVAPAAAPVASSITTTGLTLSWTAGTDNMGVAGYNVYQNGGLVKTLNNVLTCTIDSLDQGTEYTFTIKTRDRAGNLSSASEVLRVSTVVLTIEAPNLKDTYIVDEFTNGEIPVSCAVSATAQEYTVTLRTARLEYRVADAAEGTEWTTGDLACSEAAASGRWLIRGVEDGYLPMGNYHLRFTATDSNGGVATSAPVSVVLLKRDDVAPTVPGAPVSYSHSTTAITFHWQASTDNVGVDHYEVWRGETKVSELAAASYTDTGLAMGQSYSYTVKAVDARGNISAASAATNLSTMTLEFDSVITFDASYTMEAQAEKQIPVWAKFKPEQGYTPDVNMSMEYKTATQTEWTAVALTVDGRDANRFGGVWALAGSDQGYLPAGSYTVRFAVTDGSAKAYSKEQTVALARDAVKPVVAALAPQSGTYGGKALTLSATATDNVGVSRLVLSYAPGGSSDYVEITTLTSKNHPAEFSGNYTWDAGTLATGNYTIRAVAYDARGNASDAATGAIAIDNTPPETPADLSVTGTSRYIRVMWDNKYSAPSDFSRFNVYRATAENGEYTHAGGSNSIGYFDDGESVTADTTYYYYVTAQDKYGNESTPTGKGSAMLIADSESPTIGDMLPRENAALRKAVTICVTAADNYRLDKAVFEYRASGTQNWSPIAEVPLEGVSNNTTFSYAWDISALATGTYEIRASVYDDSINDVAVGGGYTSNAPAVMTRTVRIAAYQVPAAPVASAVSEYQIANLSWSYGGDVDTLKQFIVYQTNTAGEGGQYVAAVKAGASGNYVAKIPATGKQYFMVEARDKYGASAYSAVISVTSAGSDTEKPAAVMAPTDLVANVDTPVYFSAANSKDNDAIASYGWDFGDNTAGSTEQNPTHTYASAGIYTVTLTVTDAAGNSDTATGAMTVYNVAAPDSKFVQMNLSVVDGSQPGVPGIGNAAVQLVCANFEGSTWETAVTTDENGQVSVVIPKVACTISVVKDGYAAATRAVKMEPVDGAFTYQVALTPTNVSMVDGSLSHSEMTYDEILNAGIDVTDPDNQHVWKFAATFEFVAGPALPFELPVTAYYNGAGDFVGGDGWGWTSLGGGGGGMNIGIFPISEHFVLVIYGEAHWLKEMYNVELLVVNNSYADDITDCMAVLDLPEGLSLADMTGAAQSAGIDLGTIAHKVTDKDGNTAKAVWYVRGDAEGEYNLTATVTGNNPEPFVKTFTTDKPLKVYAGNALKLTITAEDIAYRGEEYHVRFKLENVSAKNLYNLSFGITGAEQFKVVRIGEGEANLPLTQDDFADGMTQSVDVLKPGGSITIDFSTTLWFNSVLHLVDMGPLDVGYYLTSVFVTTLEGSTTEIPYTVEITHVDHGTFFEWAWDEIMDEIIPDPEAELIDLIDEKFLGDLDVLPNFKKVYEYKAGELKGAASKAEIKIEGGYATSSNNFLRNRAVGAISVYTDAAAENCEVSPDGTTMTITGDARIYVQGESEGTATMTVTTYTMKDGKAVPHVATLNYRVSGEAGVAAEIILRAPAVDTVAVPLVGATAAATFPHIFVDANGKTLTEAANATWTITGGDTTGLTVDKGVLTVASTAKAGTYTVRLALSDSVYKEQTITLTREGSAATTLRLYRDEVELEAADTLVVPVTDTSATYTYTAKLFDQYGVEMNEQITWVITGNTSGAAVSDSVVTLSKDTQLGSLILTAEAAGRSASVTVTITNLAVDWSAVTAKGITYGDKNSVAVTLPAFGTASAGGESVSGTFSVKDANTIQAAGDKTVTVEFKVTTVGDYTDVVVSKSYPVAVTKRAVTVTADNKTKVYGEVNPDLTFTVPNGALVGNDTKTSLGVTMACVATSSSPAGTAVDITGTGTSDNYTVTVTKGSLTITKAAITGFQTVAPTAAVLANNAKNTDAAAVKAAITLPATVTVTYKDGTAELPIVWGNAAEGFNVKGGVYTYKGTITPGTNFNAYTATLDAKLTVTPVTATISQVNGENATKLTTPVVVAKSKAAGASTYADLKLPASIQLTYSGGVEAKIYSSLEFNVSLVTLKAAAVGSKTAVRVVVEPWVTMDEKNLTVEIQITDKYPVGVTVTQGNGIYGTPLTAPVATQQVEEDDTDPSATWSYLYKGTTTAGTAYSSEEKPTQAGTYTVTATLVSETHSGSATSAAFTIAQKTLANDMLTITGTYTYTGSAITPTYTVADASLLKPSDYIANVSDNISAGNGKVTVTAVSTGNYTGSIEKTFAIAKASISAAKPMVIGTGVVGNVLSANFTPFELSNVTWQWLRGGEPIVGAVERSYLLTPADSNKSISVRAKATPDGNYTGTTLDGDALKVAKQAASGTVAVTLSGSDDGTAKTGSTLTAVVGFQPSEAESGATYQWYRGETVIDGAVNAAYIVTETDAGAVLKVVATAGADFTGTAQNTVAVGKKLLDGTLSLALTTDNDNNSVANIGDVLTATLTGDAAPEDYTLVWLANKAVIEGATGTTYTVTAANQGKEISVSAQAKGETYTGELLSNGIAVPAGVPAAPQVTARAGDGTIYFAWTVPTDNGAPVLGYDITFTGAEETTQLPATARDVIMEGLTNGTAYTLTLIAKNSVGSSAPGSATATPATPYNPGGGGSSSNTTTETKKNEDGSITKTVTDKKTGQVTITTTNTDGSKVETTIPKGGEAISKVTVPKGKTSKVTIPAKETRPGTVVVIVKADGTEEIVKTSVATNGGVKFVATGDVTVKLVNNSKSFADVDAANWAAGAVAFATSRELFNGTGKESFSPAADMSRAMLVTVLARLDGQDTAKGDTWDAVGVAWAKEQGISDGKGLNDAISREQLAVMLYRYAKANKTETDLKDFSDVGSVSSWAADAMNWAVASGIITGKAGALDPQGNASRAEVATMLERFVGQMIK